MATLNPYVSFRDNAREAMEFYQSALGGDLTTNTFGEYGDPDAPEANLIMHSQLTTPAGFTLMGADTPPGMEHNPGSNIAISLSGDGDELRGYWEKLSDGGHRDGAPGEADVGRRVRHAGRPLRHRLDGQHRGQRGVATAPGGPDSPASRAAEPMNPSAGAGR